MTMSRAYNKTLDVKNSWRREHVPLQIDASMEIVPSRTGYVGRIDSHSRIIRELRRTCAYEKQHDGEVHVPFMQLIHKLCFERRTMYEREEDVDSTEVCVDEMTHEVGRWEIDPAECTKVVFVENAFPLEKVIIGEGSNA